MTLESLLWKKVALLGLGKNNQGLADYFDSHGVEYSVFQDWKKPEELTEKLMRFEVLFRTPGLPYLSEPIQKARDQGILVYSQTKLFFDLCPAQIIGVTGTKGKGTTAALIRDILEASGKKVWLAGNIGQDPFEFLDEIRTADVVILELSSFQLQDLHKSPHIAVVLNIIADEHIDNTATYATHYSEVEYFDSKANILKYQKDNDFAVLHPDLPDWLKKLGYAQKLIIDTRDALGYKTRLLGKHNFENIAAAVVVAKIFQVPEIFVQKAVATFSGLPHRLEFLGTYEGITYVDDSGATTPAKTIAAIEAVSGEIILILGGSLKKVDYQVLAKFLEENPRVRGLVVVGAATPIILKLLSDFHGQILTGAKNMDQILAQARSLAHSGDTILLSPATASHDMFKDFIDRGEQFSYAAKYKQNSKN